VGIIAELRIILNSNLGLAGEDVNGGSDVHRWCQIIGSMPKRSICGINSGVACDD
jgi:hypothetical protein